MAKPVINAHSIIYIQEKKLRSVSYRRIRSRIERMIDKDPKIEHYLDLAYLEARKQYWDRAQVAIESAFRLEEENPDVHLLMAQILEKKKKIVEAKNKYQTLLKDHPHFSKAYREFGRFLMSLDISNKLAQTALLKALELNPQDPMAHIFLAEIFIHKERQAQALLHLEIAERYQELEPFSHEHLAQLWMQLANYHKAVKQWKLAMQMDPRNKSFRMQFRQAEKSIHQNKSKKAKSNIFWEKWGFK